MSTMAAQYSNYQVPPVYATSSTTASPYASQQQAPPPPAQNPMYSSTASQVEHATLQRRRSHSFDATTVASKFDPYASVTANHNPHAPHQYESHVQPGNSFVNGSSQAYGSSFTGAAPPPPTYSQFNQMEFTTSGLPSQYDYNNFAQPPPPQQVQQQQNNNWNPSSSQTVVSEVTFQTHAATNNNHNFDANSGGDLLGGMTSDMVPKQQDADDDEFANVDPKLVAEQERIMQDIQARNKMAQIRKNAGVAQSSHAMVPSSSGGYSGAMVPHNGRGPPTRSRSMPHPGSNPKSGIHSIARGGVAVLDPKKDLRKQTRKMKTAGGAVGGAVVGGLVLGPVGVVLGAGGGAAAANKMAKSRDKRKQQKFEQQNFQRGANQSMTRKGDNSFA